MLLGGLLPSECIETCDMIQLNALECLFNLHELHRLCGHWHVTFNCLLFCFVFATSSVLWTVLTVTVYFVCG